MTFRFDRALKHTNNLPKPFMARFPVQQDSSQRLRWKGESPALWVAAPGRTEGSRAGTWQHPGVWGPPLGDPEPLSPEPSLGAPWLPCPSRPRCHGRAAASCNGGGVKRRAAMVRSECHQEPLCFASLPSPGPRPSSPRLDPLPRSHISPPHACHPFPTPSPCPGSQPLPPLPLLLFTQLH